MKNFISLVSRIFEKFTETVLKLVMIQNKKKEMDEINKFSNDKISQCSNSEINRSISVSDESNHLIMNPKIKSISIDHESNINP